MKSNKERLKSIITNISTSLFLKVIDLLVDFISIPIALKLVGVSNYGFWLLIFSLQNWLNILDAGVKNSVRNRLAIIEPGLRQKVISSSYVITVTITVIIFIVTFLIAAGNNYLGIDLKLEGNQNSTLILVIIGLAFGPRAVLRFVDVIFLSFHLPRVIDLLATIGKVVVLLSIILMLHLTSDGGSRFYEFLILSLFIPHVVHGIANIYFYKTKFKSMVPKWNQVDLSITREVLKSGSSFMLLTVGRIILLFSNSLLIGYFFDYESVAEVQIGFKIFNYLMVLLTIINNPFWNHFTEKYKFGDLDWIRNSLKKLLQGWLVLGVVAVIMSLNLNFLVSFITADAVSVSKEVSLSLCLFTLLYTLNLIFTSFINSTGKLRIHNVIILICILVTPLLAWLLAIKLGLGVNGVLISSNIVIAIILVVKIYHTQLLLKMKDRGIWAK